MTDDTPDLSGRTFLIADDQSFIRNLIQGALRRYGAEDIIHAASGREALTHLATPGAEIDCAICDWNMEPVTGLELLQMIRAGSAPDTARDQCVVMLTGHADSPVVNTALELDVHGFLVKPVAQDKLIGALQQAMTSEIALKPVEAYKEVDLVDVPDTLDDPDGRTSPWVIWPKRENASAPPDAAIDTIRNEAETAERHPNASAYKNKRRRPLDYVDPGAVLAEDIVSEDGTVLLGAGVVLTDHILTRLKEIASANEHRAYVVIGEPSSEAASE